MELVLERKYKKPLYTIGVLTVDGKVFCQTLEDTDRGLTSNMSDADIKRIKVPSATAIPTGSYAITLEVVSPKFSQYKFYSEFCKGKLPRLTYVKGFEGILIHCAVSKLTGEEKVATPDWTDGCILVGKNTVTGGLTNTKQTFIDLYNRMLEAIHNNEKITLTIK